MAEEGVKRVILHCDNVAVVCIARGMVSASKVIMRELRVWERFLGTLKVSVETRWLPSAANVHADRLSR